MKLSGIRSSKSRAIIHEQNESKPPPDRENNLFAQGHKPIERDGGALGCTGCGTQLYSPAAFAAHLAGKSPRDAVGGVYVTGNTDPWHEHLKRSEGQSEAPFAETDAGAVWRAEMVDKYYEQLKRPRSQPGQADGVSPSMLNDD